MKRQFNKIPLWYLYIFFVVLLMISMLFIVYVKNHKYDKEYRSPFSSDSGNFKVSILNKNQTMQICDIKIYLDNIKLIHNDYYYDGSGHNNSIYIFDIKAGNYTLDIQSDTLQVTSTDLIEISDLLWVVIELTDSVEVNYYTEELLFALECKKENKNKIQT